MKTRGLSFNSALMNIDLQLILVLPFVLFRPHSHSAGEREERALIRKSTHDGVNDAPHVTVLLLYLTHHPSAKDNHILGVNVVNFVVRVHGYGHAAVIDRLRHRQAVIDVWISQHKLLNGAVIHFNFWIVIERPRSIPRR